MATWYNPNEQQQQQQNGGVYIPQQNNNANATNQPVVVLQGKLVTPPTAAQVQVTPVSVYDNSTGGTYNQMTEQQQQQRYTKYGSNKYKHYDNYDDNNNNNNNNTNTTTIVAESMRQDKPQQQYRDVIWGVLFYIHLTGMIILSIIYSPNAFNTAVNNYASNSGQRFLEEDYNGNGSGGEYSDNSDTDSDTSSSNIISTFNPITIITLICIAGFIGIGLATASMGFMISYAEPLVKIALIFNIITFGCIALLSLLVGNVMISIMFTVIFFISICYTRSVWSRIPFAASNLVTAVHAVKSNMGLTFYSYISMILVFGWSIIWTISAGSTVFTLSNCNNNGECQNDPNPFLLFLLFISFYWTIQVILNVVHVTTAGTVGTWWFNPIEANGCCSNAVRDSYVRSLTTSFGSICFGSLLVAIIQAIKEMVHQMRNDGDQILLCIAECLIGCIESLMEYFNKWAFVYVGLYGFSFMEAGTNVMTMFRNRGWTTIITDSMVDTVLFMVAVGVGGIAALCTIIVSSLLYVGSNTSSTLGTAGIIGFLVGYAMVSTMLSVVSSAVNTVIVLYAEAPNEFQSNHPELSNRMRDSWRAAWPNDFTY